jgi:ParB-like chromosome segregation protein Spo0J
MQKAKTKKMVGPKIQSLRLSELKTAAYNPRVITDEALAGLAASMERFGCVEPIVVNIRGGTKTIIGGHQRVRVLRKLKVKEAVCVTVSLTRSEEKLLNITLNNPECQGRFIDGLAGYIDRLRKQLADDKAFLGLRLAELRKSLAGLGPEGLSEEFKLPDGEKSGFQLMSFTLADRQAELVKRAIERAKKMGDFSGTSNPNSNGNALARICERFLQKCSRRKS